MLTSGCSLVQRREELASNTVTKSVPVAARADDAGPRPRVVFLPISDSSQLGSVELRSQIRADLIREIQKREQVVLLDPRDLNMDLQKMQANGEYDATQLSKVAYDLGANYILEAKIQDIQLNRKADEVGILKEVTHDLNVNVRMRLISAKNGKETFNQSKTVSSTDSAVKVAVRSLQGLGADLNQNLLVTLLDEAFLDLLPDLASSMDKMTWEGRVAMVNGERIYLNVGRLSGLQLGDILKVTEDGQDVFDPETGLLIGRVPGRMKGTLEIISYFGTDGAISVVHSGSGFKENDRIQMY
jgi:hypothetical protein